MSCSGLIYTFDSSVANVNLFVAFSDSASEGALQAYEAISKAGGLRASNDAMMIAASKQASLATAQSYLQKPPSIQQRSGLLQQINTLQHSKGPGWISEHGIDKNLGSTNQRSNNNNLTLMLPSSDNDDDEVELVENAKIDSNQTNVGKVKRMREHCRGAINYNTPMKDLSPNEQVVQNELKQAMRFYGEKISKGEDTCKVQVIEMVDGSGEDWEKGQSQPEHQRFMNIEGYK